MRLVRTFWSLGLDHDPLHLVAILLMIFDRTLFAQNSHNIIICA